MTKAVQAHALSEHWFKQCGGLEHFLANYWQKKPLLIRQAIADFTPPIDANELSGLSLEDDIESRLIIENTQQTPSQWDMQCGPFTETDFQTLPTDHWTLLVQAVDQWIPEVQDLLAYFDFLPQWRLDDIMVSYAADQGSVGPHYDQYDVFLLQAEGQRRWKIGQQCDENTPLLDGSALKILKDFEQQNEWLLEPGDILYLPPALAHWGIAEGECMTYSIGFRSPTATEMLSDLATELLAQENTDTHTVYRDPPLTPAMANSAIGDDFIEEVRTLLLRKLDDKELLRNWFARYMTTRKYPDMELLDGELLDRQLLDGELLDREPQDDDIPTPPWSGDTVLAHHPASRFAVLSGNTAKLAVDGDIYNCDHRFAVSLSNNKYLAINSLGKLAERESDLINLLLNQGSLLIAE